MANNQIRMPSSGAGLTTFYDESKSSIHLTPQAVVGLTIVVIVVAILLNAL
ncbi:MAG: preprotein translocase subunit Sec61beta [Nanoarchaeota archaeon]|nr:preprotein translocase subunit Sec61beta [Nanoarchaeota archaeon]